MAVLSRAPVSLIWSIAKTIQSGTLFADQLAEIETEWKRISGVEIKLTGEQLPEMYRATFPRRNLPGKGSRIGRREDRQPNRIRGEADDRPTGFRHNRMVIFTDQYRFGGSTRDSRQPFRSSEHHMRAKFDGPTPNRLEGNQEQYEKEEILAARLYLFTWGLSELFNNGKFKEELRVNSDSIVKTIDNVNILPEVSEIQEEIIELPTVNAVALNFTVYTD